jgi:hypothetical protein
MSSWTQWQSGYHASLTPIWIPCIIDTDTITIHHRHRNKMEAIHNRQSDKQYTIDTEMCQWCMVSRLVSMMHGIQIVTVSMMYRVQLVAMLILYPACTFCEWFVFDRHQVKLVAIHYWHSNNLDILHTHDGIIWI